MSGSSRILDVFSRMDDNEGAFIPFIVAGDPSINTCIKIIKTLDSRGADIIELGIPHSDPIADGPTIQRADYRSLSNGTNPEIILEMIKTIRNEKITTPIVLLTYYNIVYQYGVENFINDFSFAGANGVIVADLLPENAITLINQGIENEFDIIFLVSLLSNPQRIHTITQYSTGFLYLISQLGTTGVRRNLNENIEKLILRIKRYQSKRLPIAVGFGLSTKKHIQDVISMGANGAIVGSAIINLIEKHINSEEQMLHEIGQLCERLKSGTIISR